MILSNEQKAHYWGILSTHCQSVAGSAGLGNKTYQHIGFVIGPKYNNEAFRDVQLYALTDAKEQTPAALFDAIVNTHRLRVAWKVGKGGTYIELWSAYNNVAFDASETARVEFIKLLDVLALNQEPETAPIQKNRKPALDPSFYSEPTEAHQKALREVETDFAVLMRSDNSAIEFDSFEKLMDFGYGYPHERFDGKWHRFDY